MIGKIQYISQEPHLSGIQNVCEAGCDWIQLRLKGVSEFKYLKTAQECKAVTDLFQAKLIINDNLDVALKVGAFGVHLGKNDMNLSLARKIAGQKFVIGGSTNSLDDILKAVDHGVDYLGLGPYRFTSTKTDLNPILGLEGMGKIMNEVLKRNIKIPIIAIGGITSEDIPSLVEIGVYGVAVSGLIFNAEDRKALFESLKSSFFM